MVLPFSTRAGIYPFDQVALRFGSSPRQPAIVANDDVDRAQKVDVRDYSALQPSHQDPVRNVELHAEGVPVADDFSGAAQCADLYAVPPRTHLSLPRIAVTFGTHQMPEDSMCSSVWQKRVSICVSFAATSPEVFIPAQKYQISREGALGILL
jgi:hypothetical protein